NVEKKLKNLKIGEIKKNEILDDVDKLQLCESEIVFRNGQQCQLEIDRICMLNKSAESVLKYPSVILTASDFAVATRTLSKLERKQVADTMLTKNVLKQDMFFVTHLLNNKLIIYTGYAKCVPIKDDEELRFNVINIINEFELSWERFQSYFDTPTIGV
ncbi:unnamed protein product, partial [Didymodactylos carnosus]